MIRFGCSCVLSDAAMAAAHSRRAATHASEAFILLACFYPIDQKMKNKKKNVLAGLMGPMDQLGVQT